MGFFDEWEGVPINHGKSNGKSKTTTLEEDMVINCENQMKLLGGEEIITNKQKGTKLKSWFIDGYMVPKLGNSLFFTEKNRQKVKVTKEKEVMLNSLVHWIKNGEFKKDFDEHREMRRIQGVKLKEAKNKK